MDYLSLSKEHAHWTDAPGYPLEHDIPKEEYDLRRRRARAWMADAELDALVVTSSAVGRWFTSAAEPHEWHDVCSARSAWYVLTASDDVLFMTPTAAGEHFNTTRRSTWVSQIKGIVERTPDPSRVELWAIEQIPDILASLGLGRARIGFELGDCMTLGLSVLDFLKLRDLMHQAELVDGSRVVRQLMSTFTPWEIEQLSAACRAGDWIHAQTPRLLKPGQTERAFVAALSEAFAAQFPDPYDYTGVGGWDVRNADDPTSLNAYHAVVTDRVFRPGDVVMRGFSGASYRGYAADTDRVWSIGTPAQPVLDLYQMAWDCNRAMAAEIRPGNRCCDVYAAGARMQVEHGYAERRTGRTGHGYRNTGGLSVHPDNRTELQPGMILSVEPMFPTEYGFFDLEDQYVVTQDGAVCLHEPAPRELPVIEV